MIKGLKTTAGVLGLTALCACGFTPLYAEKDSGLVPSEDKEVLAETAKIYVEPIADRLGQIMRQDLNAAFSPRTTSAKIYTLRIVNKETLYSEQGIREDSIPTRVTLGYTAYYDLFKGDEVLLSDSVFSQSSYNILQSGYSTVMAEDSIRRQIVHQLADDIALRVTAYLKSRLIKEQGIKSKKPSSSLGSLKSEE